MIAYSFQTSLEGIRARIRERGACEGATLWDLLPAEGDTYGKNDIFVALYNRDIWALLDVELLADSKTTRIFLSESDAERHRLIHHSVRETKGPVVDIGIGECLLWNGAPYTVRNISDEIVYIQAERGEPFPLARTSIEAYAKAGHLVLPERILVSAEQRRAQLKPYRKAWTPEQCREGRAKLRFLDALEVRETVNPEHFGLPKIHWRTVQRWKARAKESERKYGHRLWGVMARARPGRPRNEISDEMRKDIEAVGKELYFQPVAPTVAYCWREFKRRRKAVGLPVCSRRTFTKRLRNMANKAATVTAREGEPAAYDYTRHIFDGENWITADDYPFKCGQLDTKLLKIGAVDDNTGEYLGRINLASLVLPSCGTAPIGYAILFEKPSYRLATLAVRDAFLRWKRIVRYLIVDNGKEFQNEAFDLLLASLDCSRCDRLPNNARFAAQIESFHKRLDVELTDNLVGNTKPLRYIRDMTDENDPVQVAVWPITKIAEMLEQYLMKLLWKAPSASLGTSPENALALGMVAAPDLRRIVIPEAAKDVFFLPEVDHKTRLVQPARGISVHGYYYWCDEMDRGHVERKKVGVRYDPYDLNFVYADILGEWRKCNIQHGPEIRNMTEKTRQALMVARRRLRDTHGARHAETHGTFLAELHAEARTDEAVLLEQRKQNAQRALLGKDASPPPATNSTVGVPEIDLSHL